MSKQHNVTFEDWEAERMRNPEFRAACEAREAEYQAERLRILEEEGALMGCEKGIATVIQYRVWCDCCGSQGGSRNTRQEAQDFAESFGFRFGVEGNGEKQDLCEGCFLLWQREQALETEAGAGLDKCDPLELDKLGDS